MGDPEIAQSCIGSLASGSRCHVSQSPKLIFVVGVGRSGTSLLQSMLAAHPAIASVPETAFLRRYGATASLERVRDTSGIEAVVQALQQDELVGRTKLDVTALVKDVPQSSGQLDLQLYQQILNRASGGTRPWIVDKDPRMIEFLPVLKAAARNAQVVHIIRDPRDVLASKKKAAWSRSGHVWKHVFANRVQLRLGRSQGRRLFGSNYHEILYEELIASPADVLSAVCKEMGVPYDESMLEFSDAAGKLVSKDELSWKSETLGPLLRHNKKKWRSSLSPRETMVTEACCMDAMRTGRYEKDELAGKLQMQDRVWTITGVALIKLMTRPYEIYRKNSLRMYASTK